MTIKNYHDTHTCKLHIIYYCLYTKKYNNNNNKDFLINKKQTP